MENWLGLGGKVVIVTGGANGIGYAVAEEFLKDGAKVAVCDIAAEAPIFCRCGQAEFFVRQNRHYFQSRGGQPVSKNGGGLRHRGYSR